MRPGAQGQGRTQGLAPGGAGTKLGIRLGIQDETQEGGSRLRTAREAGLVPQKGSGHEA